MRVPCANVKKSATTCLVPRLDGGFHAVVPNTNRAADRTLSSGASIKSTTVTVLSRALHVPMRTPPVSTVG
jgi:hypothetical protein